MAISDGEPRQVAPDLFNRLNWIERQQATKAYAARHVQTGDKFPADEAPASIARRTMVMGAWGGGIFVMSMIMIALCFTVILAELDFSVPVIFGLVALVSTIGLGIGWLRARWINSYFEEHFPGSLDFRHGTTSEG